MLDCTRTPESVFLVPPSRSPRNNARPGWTTKPDRWVILERMVKEAGGNVTHVAGELNLSETSIYIALKKLRRQRGQPAGASAYREKRLAMLAERCDMDIVEIDWSNAPIARVYPWLGKMYGSEMTHRSFARGELK